MTSDPVPSRMRRFAKAAIAGVLLLVAFVALFDWNWIRPAVEHYLTMRSQRSVRFDDLKIEFSPALAPTVRLRGVHIQNAPWADATRPMAEVGEVAFEFESLKTVFEKPSIVARLTLIDGNVDLEWNAQGLRNWRLRNPDYTGPGRYRIRRLDAQRSHVRYVNAPMNLVLDSSAEPAPPGTAPSSSGEALTKRVRFDGTYAGAPFSVDLLTAEVLSLQETRELFPVRGQANSGPIKLAIDGKMGDFFRLGEVDARIRLSGPSLAGLHPFVRAQPPASHAYKVEGHARVTQSEYSFDHFRGTLGETDLSGSASFSRNAPRRFVRADLRSELFHLADLPAFAAAGGETGAATDHVFSRKVLHAERLKNEDVHLALDVKKFAAPGMPMLQSLRATADLKDGVLTLAPFDLGVAGGHAMGRVSLDSRQQPLAASATLDLHNVQPDQLAAKLRQADLSGGAITARVSLAGRGDSVAAILGSASGTLSASMAGGSMSELLDAKLGLNLGKLVWLKLTGDHDIPVNCAALAFDIRNGVGSSHTLILDTGDTRFSGAATVNLRDERFDLLLTPHAKKTRLLALGNAIRAGGSFSHPGYSIDKSAPSATAVAQEPAGHGQC